ncbi:MAG: S1 RNA-binding domain-containing protein, partial [Parvibaculum sp.]|nr:S1 RNA-binding domain-containing protein [Parvibaculum sp.]
MGKKMLIDAAHPEETRVVVVSGNRVEEFDFESENRKQLRGNIYLAKVTRVEPSLQAAFVEYGGNRHGFLAFSEIHPDYYQIPVADREALLKQQADEARREKEEEDDDDAEAEAPAAKTNGNGNGGNDAEDSGDDHSGDIERGETETVLSDETVESVGAEDAMEEAAPRKQRINYRSYKIQEVIKRRQILLVQVVKEERGNKGAALTTYLSLAGRY